MSDLPSVQNLPQPEQAKQSKQTRRPMPRRERRKRADQRYRGYYSPEQFRHQRRRDMQQMERAMVWLAPKIIAVMFLILLAVTLGNPAWLGHNIAVALLFTFAVTLNMSVLIPVVFMMIRPDD